MSANKHDLLIEIGTEELPPKALGRLCAAFTDHFTHALGEADLDFAGARAFAAPRRLAILVRDLDAATPDKVVEKRGPALKAAFDDEGCPTRAAEGFARSCGVKVEDLETLQTDKGSWLVWRSEQKGQPVTALVPAMVQAALDALPIPKRMRWGSLDVQFVRPVHWVVMLYGEQVIDGEILGIRAGRATRGHRFHAPQAIDLPVPADYEPLLESEGKVIADFERRREMIRAQVEAEALKLGGRAVIDTDLLDEVTAMVERPVAVAGTFEERFLAVPQEALVSTMSANQKYFHLVDEDGTLLPHFVTIANIESRDPAVIRDGNERVIRPRFADAEFFWNQDRKTPLIDRLPRLKQVVFQRRLGTLYDKAMRLTRLAAHIAAEIGGDRDRAIRAAELCKCDLMTEMVGEFPDLQGIIGRYYALHDGEDKDVAVAIDQHYRPRFAGDDLPENPTARALALADRIDILLGIFAIGQTPTGDKDPYALRRAALGVLRILIETNLDLDLAELLTAAASGFPAVVEAEAARDQVLDFILDRLRAYYADRGIRPDVLDAVMALKITRPRDIDRRVHAVTGFRQLPEAESLAAANKRIGNILRKVEGKLPEMVDPKRFTDDAEKALFEAFTALEADVKAAIDAGDYTDALEKLATLRKPVDRFFDEVMVMADDPKLRDNRIALLNHLHRLFLQVADIAKLQ